MWAVDTLYYIITLSSIMLCLVHASIKQFIQWSDYGDVVSKI